MALSPDPEFVKIVNLLYHEQEAAIYDRFHPEIFAHEKKTWRRLATFLPKSSEGRTLLDIGSGTGFVPVVLGALLAKEDTIIVTDVSSAMLEKARAKLAQVSGPHIAFRLASAETLPYPDASMDAVTLNSVLHHIADTRRFLQEIDRVLKPGGVILIAHEPNRLFYMQPLLQGIQWPVRKWFALKYCIRKASKLFSVPLGSAVPYAMVYREVNRELKKRGLIESNLSPEEIQCYVDVHSPTASVVPNTSKGFIPHTLARAYLPGYRIRHLGTWAHLGKFSAEAKGILDILEKILRLVFPRSGSSFSLALEKPRKT